MVRHVYIYICLSLLLPIPNLFLLSSIPLELKIFKKRRVAAYRKGLVQLAQSQIRQARVWRLEIDGVGKVVGRNVEVDMDVYS